MTDYMEKQEYPIIYGDKKQVSIITIILIILNVAIWIVLEIFGDTTSGSYILQNGGMYPEAVLVQNEWYRLFSSMFIHFGPEHLANNMIMLVATGDKLERAVGKWQYLTIYLCAGLAGNFLSLYEMIQNEEYAVGAGASGAIFGVIGALIWVAVRNRGKFEDLTTHGLILMVALCLYYGIRTTGVDNWAHIGGAAGGFLLCIFLYRKA